MIQRLPPLSTHASPSSTARVRMPAASLPASGSDSAYENIASPRATGGRYLAFSSAEPLSMIGSVPSLLTAGISELDAQARATSSMTMQAASASPPIPSYSSGMWIACRSAATSAA